MGEPHRARTSPAVVGGDVPGWSDCEIGTGTGVGAGWLADGLQQDATLLTVEVDPRRAEAASKVFEDRDDVTVVCGDWKAVFENQEPFEMLFVDGGGPDMLARSTDMK